MIALASPTADGPFRLVCRTLPPRFAGQALPWRDLVELSQYSCGRIANVIRHRDVSVAEAADLAGSLLHEAAHVAQYREAGNDPTVFSHPTRRFEHDAECRALAGMPRVLRTLHYTRHFIAAAYRYFERVVAGEPRPYGGRC